MNHTRHASMPTTARMPHAWPSAAMARGRHDAGVGTRSNKVRLRRRPVRSSSRFVCEAILEAFEKALDAQSFEACTTNHIADLAGVGIGSFYEYFSNKETVLALWLYRHSSRLLADFDRLVDDDIGTALELQVDAIVAGVLERYAHKLHVWRQIAHAVYAISTDEQCARCAREFSRRWQRLLERHYPTGRERKRRLADTAAACHDQLLAHIEEAIVGGVGGADDLVSPQVRQRNVDSLLRTIHGALGPTQT